MFSIESLWENPKLAPLKKAYDENKNDRRLVVVVGKGNSVDIAETVALHTWLERHAYQHIPSLWDTNTDTLDVIHVSKLALEVLRRDPFSPVPAPLPPQSWLNKLSQERFDALLLGQQDGSVPMQPTRLQIVDTIKPALEAQNLSLFWSEMVDNVKFAQSGEAPKNDNQHRIIALWALAVKRRHYDPTSAAERASNQQQPQMQDKVVRSYVWFLPGESMFRWNYRLTELRNWIEGATDNIEQLKMIADEIFGRNTRITWTGNIQTDAHTVVQSAVRHDLLSALANRYNYIQPPSDTDNSSHNRSVHTNGGAYIAGHVNTGGGDFNGRDLIIINR